MRTCRNRRGKRMGTEIVSVPLDAIRPYGNNPRDNAASVPRVAASIREFGFLQPIVCDGDGIILAGHTRYEAAKSLGMKEVPVLYATGLSGEQGKAYRLADNRAGEDSAWIEDLLTAELESLPAGMEEFGFGPPGEIRRRSSWRTAERRCGLKKKVTLRTKCGFGYTSFFSTGREGRTLEEIKGDPGNIPVFADNLADYLLQAYGVLEGNGWCLCTTPRRRHREGVHFSTEICRLAARQLGIPFHEDTVTAGNRGRIEPEFTLAGVPPEDNVILYDDILTTGITVRETRGLLLEAGKTVPVVIAIRNG